MLMFFYAIMFVHLIHCLYVYPCRLLANSGRSQLDNTSAIVMYQQDVCYAAQ